MNILLYRKRELLLFFCCNYYYYYIHINEIRSANPPDFTGYRRTGVKKRAPPLIFRTFFSLCFSPLFQCFRLTDEDTYFYFLALQCFIIPSYYCFIVSD